MENKPTRTEGKPGGESGAGRTPGPAGRRAQDVGFFWGAWPGSGSAEHPVVSLQRSDEVELLPVLTGEDGRLLVVLHQLVHGVEKRRCPMQ